MNKWLRYGGLAVLLLVGVVVALEVLSIVFGIVSFLVEAVVSVLVLGVLLYLAYLAVSKLRGGGGSGGGRSRSREKDKIFE
ncbi:hypothetical protein NGM10_02260 [Halorussus salilacus]|uniref:hypothetical protein n=1 Tax=Halorussus salilacus TaxID=2953750 RepID=UPI0020A14840|nr:hypothetical protein [Halorussus salilacus]USZ68575.1 hypothetical protein NGM10_02260 [Halorussus salilacus]